MQVAESIQNASPTALADELVTHLGVSLEGGLVGVGCKHEGDDEGMGLVGAGWLTDD